VIWEKKMIGQIPSDASGAEPSQSVSPPAALPQPASPSAYAIAAFALGIVSFSMCCAGIPALVLGLIELRNIKNRISPAEGKPFAMIGTILGGVSTVLMFVIGFFYAAFIMFMALFAER
jgi:hypothetical protein